MNQFELFLHLVFNTEKNRSKSKIETTILSIETFFFNYSDGESRFDLDTKITSWTAILVSTVKLDGVNRELFNGMGFNDIIQ